MAARSRKSGGQPADPDKKPRSRSRRKKVEPAPEAAPPDIAQLIGREIEREFAQAISPVVGGIPDQIMTAIEPALQQLRDELARVVRRQSQQALEITPRLQIQGQSGAGAGAETSPPRSHREPDADREREQDTVGSDQRETGDRTEMVTQDRAESQQGESGMADNNGENQQQDSGDTGQNQDQQATQNQDRPQASQATPNGDQTGEATGNQDRPQGQSGDRGAARQRSGQGGRRETYAFDPSGAARVALLNLAQTMKDYGAVYQAINAYERILIRYPGSGAASAATQGMVELAERLQREGKIYTALNIIDKLEQHL